MFASIATACTEGRVSDSHQLPLSDAEVTTSTVSPSETISSTSELISPQTTSSEGTNYVEVSTADAVEDWAVVAGPSPDLLAPIAYNGTWSLETNELGLVTVSRPDGVGGATVLHEESMPAWTVSDAYLLGDRVLLVENSTTEADYHIFLYDLVSGDRETLEEWGGAQSAPIYPMIAQDDPWIAWATTVAQDRYCIRMRNLDTSVEYDAACSLTTGELVWWPMLDWPVLAYRREIPGDPPCLSLETINLASGEVTQIPSRGECRGFDAAGTEEFVVWTDYPPGSTDVWASPVLGATPDGGTYGLGSGAIGSLTTCAGRAYWVHKTTKGTEIRSWEPPAPVTTIYRESENRPVTQPYCNGDWLTIQVADTEAVPLQRYNLALFVGATDDQR